MNFTVPVQLGGGSYTNCSDPSQPGVQPILSYLASLPRPIEPKCDPDGICVSDVIANAARNKVPAHFASIGRQPMKNIANPPELFKVYALEDQAAQKTAKTAPAGAAVAGGNPGGVFKL